VRFKISKFIFAILLIAFLGGSISACNNPGGKLANPNTLPATPSNQKTDSLSEVSMIEFIHKGNFFSISIPSDWNINEDESFATFSAPDESATIQATVVNTGIPLDETGFTNFIANTERNNFSHLIGYVQLNNDNKSGIARISSQFSISNSLQELTSIYIHKDAAVFMLHMQTSKVHTQAYTTPFDQIILSAKFLPENINKLIPYNIGFDFIGPNNIFKISIPTSWFHVRKSITNGVVDAFTSPDNQGTIENFFYSDGNPIQKPQADQIASQLLLERYAKDVRIAEIQNQPDGSIRWTWSSARNHLSGTTYYELRGNTFLMISLYCNNAYQSVFTPLFSSIIQSYQPV
jgi:hypothetical protein